MGAETPQENADLAHAARLMGAVRGEIAPEAGRGQRKLEDLSPGADETSTREADAEERNRTAKLRHQSRCPRLTAHLFPMIAASSRSPSKSK